MANFVALFGGGESLERVGDLAPLPNLVGGCLDHGALAVRWSAGRSAPIHVGTRGRDALVCLGDAFDPETGSALGVDAWLERPGDAPSSGHDGFFACLRLADGVGQVEADHLGLFPVFYAPIDGQVAVASSPETLVRLLGDRARLDPVATVGSLLLCAGFGDVTPWRGIRRLRPGHRLTIHPGGTTIETAQSPQIVPHSERTDVLNETEGEARLYETLRAAVARQCARRSVRLLLTGGIDSRLLAGICRDLEMAPPTLTLGHASDLEVICARRVAHHLRWRHRHAEPVPTQFVGFENATAQWNHLTAGACHLGWELGWGLGEDGEAPALTGMCLDGVIYGTGGSFTESQDFDRAFSLFWNRRGVDAGLLGDLLRPANWRNAIAPARAALLDYWQGAGPDDFSRTFATHLHHRNRSQIGTCLWQLSFRAWPVVPILSRDFLRIANALPQPALHDGRLRQAMLRRRWPDLAKLPIDGNQHRTDPLLPNGLPAVDAALGKLRALQALLGHERRRYVRGLDLNGANWQALRGGVSLDPARWRHWLDTEALRAHLAPPHRSTHRFDTVIGHSAGRHLTHLLVWADRHAAAIEATLVE